MNTLLLQFDLAWHDAAANHAKLRDVLHRAQPKPGTLVVTPEMFACGFSMAVDQVAEADDGPTLLLARELAQRYGITLVLGRVVKPDDRGRNEAVVAGPDGSVLTRYHKLHPFSFAGETNHYRGGESVKTFAWTSGDESTVVAPLICYDLRFPEAFRHAVRSTRVADTLSHTANPQAGRQAPHDEPRAVASADRGLRADADQRMSAGADERTGAGADERTGASTDEPKSDDADQRTGADERAGAEVFVVIANWPAARVKHWLALLVARAIENQAYVIGVNRCGRDPNVSYPGRSVVVDPRGEIVADAGENETALPATLDLAALRAYREQFPALSDMRPDLLGR